MEKFNEILNFIIKKNLLAFLIFLVATAGVVYFCILGFSPLNVSGVIPQYKDYFDLSNQNRASLENIEQLKAQIEAEQNKKKAEKNQEKKVPVVLYKPISANMPIESSSIDLVTGVIKKLEISGNNIVDISYNILSTPQANMPTNITIIQLIMTLNSSYTAFQDFIYDLYNDNYISTIKTIKMVPLQENKSELEINTEIWLYVSK